MNNYLESLENESIHIIREAYAAFSNPVVLYSIGKDSSVLAYLVKKAFLPGKIPFPFLHIDTTLKFAEMYEFRKYFIDWIKANIIVYTNHEALEDKKDIDCTYCARFLKTEALKQAMAKYQFDVALAGGRRDEEKSRAKERIFSFRDSHMQWFPKKQRPEIWHIYNTQHKLGESFRVFPISNWTELDIWLYIKKEDIPVVPLYFAQKRDVVVRNGQMFLNSGLTRAKKGEKIENIECRFRTLGCQLCTGAIISQAKTIDDIIEEIMINKISERQNRIVDLESGDSSMETKKLSGYF